MINQSIEQQPLSEEPPSPQKSELDYELFIAVFTFFSFLIAVVLLFFSLAPEVEKTLAQINSLITFVFLADFIHLFRRAENKMAYMKSQGWLDLLGSLPVYPILRFFRIFRLIKVWRELAKYGTHPIWDQLMQRRAQNALRFTGFVVFLVITLGSILVLQFESKSPIANILTQQDAVWWSVVTIATVGYGDYYPVTWNGRFVGMVLMIVGVGMFGVLSSYLAKIFLSPTKREAEEQHQKEKEKIAEAFRVGFEAELAPLKSEVAALRTELVDIHRVLADKQDGE